MTTQNEKTKTSVDLYQLDDMKPLKRSHQTFVIEVVKTEERRKSAIIAGYNPNSAHTTASKLLNMPKIQRAIDSVRTAVSKVLDYNPEQIKAFWVGIMEDGKVKIDARVRCSELLAKANKMFSDNVTNVALFGTETVDKIVDGLNKAIERVPGRNTVDMPEVKRGLPSLNAKDKDNTNAGAKRSSNLCGTESKQSASLQREQQACNGSVQ